MKPVIRLVISQNFDWAVIYFVSNVSDKKVWQGDDYMCGAITAMANLFGCEVEMYEFTDDDEDDCCTPDTFAEIKGIKRMGQA